MVGPTQRCRGDSDVAGCRIQLSAGRLSHDRAMEVEASRGGVDAVARGVEEADATAAKGAEAAGAAALSVERRGHDRGKVEPGDVRADAPAARSRAGYTARRDGGSSMHQLQSDARPWRLGRSCRAVRGEHGGAGCSGGERNSGSGRGGGKQARCGRRWRNCSGRGDSSWRRIAGESTAAAVNPGSLGHNQQGVARQTRCEGGYWLAWWQWGRVGGDGKQHAEAVNGGFGLQRMRRLLRFPSQGRCIESELVCSSGWRRLTGAATRGGLQVWRRLVGAMT
ncbi:hypothetical protein ZWY2020_016631 [Hordeum vulgare]|nr:hypothetical protein ZWY2020_016631 [Hordeum vulgare]